MTVTTLDQKVALIVIDLQKSIFSLLNTPSMEEVVKSVAALTGTFRSNGLPVVLVNVAGVAKGRTEQKSSQRTFPPSWTDFTQEVNQQPQDHVVTKFTPGAFTKTDLEAHLLGELVRRLRPPEIA
ncbi:MAG: cysteine hydrolase family protein [Acidiferrobacter sp.]